MFEHIMTLHFEDVVESPRLGPLRFYLICLWLTSGLLLAHIGSQAAHGCVIVYLWWVRGWATLLPIFVRNGKKRIDRILLEYDLI